MPEYFLQIDRYEKNLHFKIKRKVAALCISTVSLVYYLIYVCTKCLSINRHPINQTVT